ncbi:hypothetical protein FPZ12_001105 [Amycolatopsis acidicola]|uniref:DUF1841 family protein n=1 Tax=Amycolatopsis acidicola TaxID=2596893 RepID=A0A5N0VKB3_9PSEU|nr:hypothetical protein [Amycolatopsis acidicola]KAA9166827.1 hypothetical protein FPZ12_001105 [Amycolatopsis acidicola]
MSPVSRGRKSKKKKPQSLDSELRAAFDDALAEYEGVTDVLDVELLTSDLLGEFWSPRDPERSARELLFPLLRYAAKDQSAAGFALLRAVAALAPTEELRERARETAERQSALGMREPSWAAAIEAVEVTGCVRQTDVFGDHEVLVFRCRRGETRHGLVAEIDLHGLDDVYLTVEEDKIINELEKDEGEFLSCGEIPLAEARGILEAAMAVNDNLAEAEPDEDDDPLPEARAYVLARLRAMPPAESVVSEEADVDGVVQEFFAAGKDIPDNEDSRYFAAALVELGYALDERRPLRASPGRVEAYLADLLVEGEIDESALDSLRAVVLGWARWRGAEEGLPTAAAELLLEEAEAMLAAVAEELAYAGPR